MDFSEKLRQFNEARNSLEPIGIDSKVLFIDGTNSYIRCFAAIPTMNDDGEHVGGTVGFLKSVGLAIRQHHPTRVVCVFDGAGGSLRRRKLYPEYKSNRKPTERLNRTYDFNGPIREQESMKWQLLILIQMLESLPVSIFHVDNIEADDTIGYLVGLVSERGGKSIIMSTDKDFLQLVSPSCQVYSPTKKKIYDEQAVVAEYKVHPNNFVLFRSIEGDKSDNITGVMGVGPHLLLKNYPEFGSAEKVTIDEVIAKAQDDKGKVRNKTCQKLMEGRKVLERNASLMRLDEIGISGITKLHILTRFDEPINTYNKRTLTTILSQYRLQGSFGHYDDWLQTTWVPLTRYQASKE